MPDRRELAYVVIDVRSSDEIADISARLLVGIRSLLRGWGVPRSEGPPPAHNMRGR